MSVQKAILPGLVFGICVLIGITNLLLASPGSSRTRNQAGHAIAEMVISQNKQADTQNTVPESGGCTLSNLYPESIQQWCSLIERYASENGLDPNLVSAVMLQESAGRADALSKSGAVGLMQVMPRDGKAANFMCKAGPCFADRPSMEQLYDPEYNVSYATRMLADLLQHHGNLREALRAYGPMDVGYYYADLVINIMNRYH